MPNSNEKSPYPSVIAFIPARGGSKSIPLKNIKPLCGKPLIYWSISALEKTNAIDRIIVATDSDEIEKTALSFNLPKVEIFRRSAENATDAASTESVMLEYLEQERIADSDIFILVQATSPLTESKHFSEALDLYRNNNYDSLLSCVRNYRFFWSENGNPINYDHKQRPRRQSFPGQLMENGAFYINTVGNIKQTRNRLSGRIGVYETPDYTGVEIDEPDDWIIVENLMEKYAASSYMEFYSQVKLFLSDVDGVLTDGGMYYSENGDELKKFNTRDGTAFQLLRGKGIKVGVVTSENTAIVQNRAKKLNLDYAIQGAGKAEKLAAVQKICKELGISLAETSYVGDDINCKELLENVGYAFCPKDAVEDIKSINGIKVVECNGGDGVIRNIAERFFLNN
jgi:N-acylneuraminate cytidylyltransferase